MSKSSTTRDILDRLRPWAEYDPHDLDSGGPNQCLIKDAMTEIEDLRISVIAFGAPWAVKYAEEWGLPPKHLDPRHYDILKHAGARMDDFIRGSAENVG